MDVHGYVINGMDPDPIKHPEDSDLFSNPVEGTEHIDPKTGLMDWEIGPAVDQELPTIIGDAITGNRRRRKDCTSTVYGLCHRKSDASASSEC